MKAKSVCLFLVKSIYTFISDKARTQLYFYTIQFEKRTKNDTRKKRWLEIERKITIENEFRENNGKII